MIATTVQTSCAPPLPQECLSGPLKCTIIGHPLPVTRPYQSPAPTSHTPLPVTRPYQSHAPTSHTPLPVTPLPVTRPYQSHLCQSHAPTSHTPLPGSHPCGLRQVCPHTCTLRPTLALLPPPAPSFCCCAISTALVSTALNTLLPIPGSASKTKSWAPGDAGGPRVSHSSTSASIHSLLLIRYSFSSSGML